MFNFLQVIVQPRTSCYSLHRASQPNLLVQNIKSPTTGPTCLLMFWLFIISDRFFLQIVWQDHFFCKLLIRLTFWCLDYLELFGISPHFSTPSLTRICRLISQVFASNFWIRNIFANFPGKQVWILIQVIVKFVNSGERTFLLQLTNALTR